MGGETISSLSDEQDFHDKLQLPTPNFRKLNMDGLSRKVEEDGDKESGFEESSCTRGPGFSSNDFDEKRRINAYVDVLRSYDELQHRILNLEEAKTKILSYTPGAWIENVGGMRLCDFDVPKTTVLLLIGPKGSGKSSLVNRISRVLEDDKFASDRAQVSYNPSIGDGTYFLHEYMIPRGSNSICLYDTRGLTFDSSENVNIINQWMTKGVRHGEPVMRDSDGSNFNTKMRHKARRSNFHLCEKRKVNFVIFVVNGLLVLKYIDNDSKGEEAEACYTDLVVTMFDSPLLSFKDDKPVVVITHGDLLSHSDRARIRVHLGEVLGIPPKTQIFDIPENCDPTTELTIADMLRYSLERADRNLPGKYWLESKVIEVSFPMHKLMLVALTIVTIAIFAAQILGISSRINKHQARQPENLHIDWHSIRHMWLG